MVHNLAQEEGFFMKNIYFIKQNATESGDCGNGWEGWRLGNTLYIDYTGPLRFLGGEYFLPDDLRQIDFWDENLKAEIDTLIIGTESLTELGLGLGLFRNWSNLKRIDVLASNVYYGTLEESDPEEDYSTWNIQNHFDDLLETLPDLQAVNIIGEDVNVTSEDGIIYDKERKTLLFCPRGKMGHFIIPDGVVIIEAFAFNDCRRLTNVTIPNSVNEIDICAFDGCVSLRLNIPDSVTRIGKHAFANVPHISYHGLAQSDDNWGAKSRN